MLPLEVVIAIAGQLQTARDFFNFAQTCKLHHRVLVGRPWNDIHIYFRPFLLENGSRPATKGRAIREGAVLIRTTWRMDQPRRKQCRMSPCEACKVEEALLPVNAYLDCQAEKVTKDLRELKLSGWLPQALSSVNDEAPGHTLKGAPGVCALRPEVLNVEIPWASWSPIMLSGFDLTTLKSLKMPVRAPIDCLKIGAAFMDIPHLANLTITELPDSQDFVDEFRHLGDGILALSSSLRSLDITLTNCNRAPYWAEDKAFVEPDDIAHFFKHFFPEPSCNQIKALVRARYNDPREPLDVNILQSSKGQLNLERIRLKHIGLPWWAFQTVFNPETTKELDLPRSRIASNVWDDLGMRAQLHKLTSINYEMIRGPFMNFLSTQHSLDFLSFARPPDNYVVAGIRPDAVDMSGVSITTFALTEAALHLGPGTEWGRVSARDVWLLQSNRSWVQHDHLIQSPNSWSYFENIIRSLSSYDQCQYPRKSNLVKALSNSIKHLVIPADMFDITPKFMACLAAQLPALESLEWAFDYTCPKLRACFINDFLPSNPRLSKITFLSLNRPRPLSDFDAKKIHSVFANGFRDLAPANLKYVRYRDLNGKSYKGKYTKSDVYYHRKEIADGNWWLKIPARSEDIMFEDERTPSI